MRTFRLGVLESLGSRLGGRTVTVPMPRKLLKTYRFWFCLTHPFSQFWARSLLSQSALVPHSAWSRVSLCRFGRTVILPHSPHHQLLNLSTWDGAGGPGGLCLLQ